MLRPRWRKVWADLWETRSRTLLVVASITVGVFAVGMIAGSYAIIPGAMNSSYAAANPANIVIRTDPFEKDLIRAVGHVESVAAVEGRRSVTVRLRAGETWTSLRITSLPEGADIDRLVLVGGTPRPGAHEVLLLQKTAARLGQRAGGAIEVELPDGARRQLTIAGVVKDLTSGTQGFMSSGAGYVSPGTMEWLHQGAEADSLYITVGQRPNDRAYLREVAAEVKDLLEKGGRTVYETEVYRRNEHPLASIVEAILGVLAVLGVLLVFLSGSLIANTLSALLGQQLRQIGVIKLVGGRRSQIIGMYLALVLTFGAIALLVAIPLAGWAAYALAQVVADLINFVLPPAPALPIIPLAVLVQAVMALGMPVLAGLLPVLQGSRISVQQAISSAGMNDQPARPSQRRRRVAGMRWLSRPLLISIRNTFRRKGRLALTLFTLTLGGAIFIAVFSVRTALNTTVDRSTHYFRADVNLDLNGPYPLQEVGPLLRAVPGVERVEGWAGARAQLLDPAGNETGVVTLMAPPSASQLVEPMLLEGRWLVPGDENAITVNEAFRRQRPGLHPGDRLRLKIGGREDDWTVVGVFQFTGADELFAYANYEYLSGYLHQPQLSAMYRIVTADHSLAYQEDLSARLDDYLKGLGYHVGKVEAGGALAKTITDLLGILIIVLLVMALLTALVGSIGLAGTLSMNVLERTREIGVMRAIGAHDRIILRLVIAEGLLIGLISYVLGAALSLPISVVLSDVISRAIFDTPARFSFTPLGLLIWLGVVVALTVLAGAVPARNASQLTIREVLAYE